MNNAAEFDVPAGLVSALTKLLTPLVKLLIHFRITYPFLANLLKQIYVQVASEEFSLDGKPVSDSRASILTGVHRKDVRRLLHESSVDDDISNKGSLGSQIIGAWLGGSPYSDQLGKPNPLFRLEKHGEPSFESLVESVGKKDVRSRVVLDEYLHSGAIEIDDNNMVHLNIDAFIPSAGFEEKTFFFGQNIADHLAVCEYNLTQDTDAKLERCVYYEGLSQDSVNELEEIARQSSMELLKELNRKASQHKKKATLNEEDKVYRMNFGVYFFKEGSIKQQGIEHDEKPAKK